MKKQTKNKNHRHVWVEDYCDCPRCGYSGAYVECECGETREVEFTKGKRKLAKFKD